MHWPPRFHYHLEVHHNHVSRDPLITDDYETVDFHYEFLIGEIIKKSGDFPIFHGKYLTEFWNGGRVMVLLCADENCILKGDNIP